MEEKIKCNICDEDISTNALLCPYCKSKTKKYKKIENKQILIIFGLILLFLIICMILLTLKMFNT